MNRNSPELNCRLNYYYFDMSRSDPSQTQAYMIGSLSCQAMRKNSCLLAGQKSCHRLAYGPSNEPFDVLCYNI
jgi:hypothetical protein